MSKPRASQAPGHTVLDRVALSRHAPQLFRYLARRLRRRQDAEDLVQYVYQRFLQSPQAELVRQPEAYLYRIAANVLHEWGLHQKREILLYDTQTAEDVAESLSASETSRDPIGDAFAAQQQLERVLAQIPRNYRAVLILNVREGLTCAEIAQKLGITPLTAKKYLTRALAACRAAHWDR